MTLPGADAVARLAAARPLVLCLDIDGTLAPIVPRPEEARVPDATLAALRALAAAPDTAVAFVTGRAVADARPMTPVPGAWIVGNHGAESLAPNDVHQVDPEVAAHLPAVRAAVADAAAAIAGIPGARVEDKRWSATVHYRTTAPADVPAVVAAARAAAERHGLRAVPGKQVVELRAPVAVDKGTAGAALARSLGAGRPGAAVVAAGDDVTDEDLFRALHAAFADVVAVRVGDAEVPTAAGWRAADPAAFALWLGGLAAARIGGPAPGSPPFSSSPAPPAGEQRVRLGAR